jgi:predicted XRE-type DNA-binding protein
MKKELPDHTASCGNVFADAGMEHADEHLLKARLVSRIQDQIDILKINQIKASQLMGLAQPDLSNILNGRFRGFSVERLMRCLSYLDCEVEIVIRRDGKTLATIPAYAAV